MTANRTIGRRIRKRRKARDITQTDLAAMVQRHRVTLANIEAGRYGASVPTIRRIARALRCTVADLIG